MEKKAKIGLSASMIIGIVFTGMGVAFLTAGIVTGIILSAEGSNLFLMIFGGIGTAFLLMGLPFLVVAIRRRKQMNRVLKEGHYIMAEVCEVTRNYGVRVNNRYPFLIRCRYDDGRGNVHIFKSRNIFYVPDTLQVGCPVKVYVDPNNYKHYYMDIDEVMPKVIEY